MVISFFGAAHADIPLGIVVVGVAITLASGTISGMRLHRWVFYRTSWGRRLPTDAGAWIGLISAILFLTGGPLQFFHALDQPVPLVEQRLHAGIECLLRDEPTIPLPGEGSSFCP
jgi:hypothetical protein